MHVDYTQRVKFPPINVSFAQLFLPFAILSSINIARSFLPVYIGRERDIGRYRTRNSRGEASSSAQSICSEGITRRPGAKRSGVLEPAVDGHETRRIGKRRNRRFI